MLPVSVIVGIRFGIFTPTEAAVVAATYAIFISTFVYKELSIKDSIIVLITDKQNHNDCILGGLHCNGCSRGLITACSYLSNSKC